MRWSNVPVPEPHVAAIVGAAALHAILPLRIPLGRRTRLALAGPMLATGIGLAAWAVASAGDADVESDSALVTSGAYASDPQPDVCRLVGRSSRPGVRNRIRVAPGRMARGGRMRSTARSISRRRGSWSASEPHTWPTATASPATSQPSRSAFRSDGSRTTRSAADRRGPSDHQRRAGMVARECEATRCGRLCRSLGMGPLRRPWGRNRPGRRELDDPIDGRGEHLAGSRRHVRRQRHEPPPSTAGADGIHAPGRNRRPVRAGNRHRRRHHASTRCTGWIIPMLLSEWPD